MAGEEKARNSSFAVMLALVLLFAFGLVIVVRIVAGTVGVPGIVFIIALMFNVAAILVKVLVIMAPLLLVAVVVVVIAYVLFLSQ